MVQELWLEMYPYVTTSMSRWQAQLHAPQATLQFMLGTLPWGMALLLPSLWWLFKVLKGLNLALRE